MYPTVCRDAAYQVYQSILKCTKQKCTKQKLVKTKQKLKIQIYILTSNVCA